MTDPAAAQDPDDDDAVRALAVQRVRKVRALETHVLVYLLVNAFFVCIWLLTSAASFWPVFPMAAWGIALLLHAWSVWRGEQLDESQIEHEMERIRRQRPTPNTAEPHAPSTHPATS